jgi:hypothetical protein
VWQGQGASEPHPTSLPVYICAFVFLLGRLADVGVVGVAGTLPRYTGGQVYYYPGFTPAVDGARFHWDLQHDLERETGWEAVMRIRCGKGMLLPPQTIGSGQDGCLGAQTWRWSLLVCLHGSGKAGLQVSTRRPPRLCILASQVQPFYTLACSVHMPPCCPS